MDDVLRGTESFAGVYLDDIVIHSTSWRDHLEHLAEVFRRLEEAGLTIKQKKCTQQTVPTLDMRLEAEVLDQQNSIGFRNVPTTNQERCEDFDLDDSLPNR